MQINTIFGRMRRLGEYSVSDEMQRAKSNGRDKWRACTDMQGFVESQAGERRGGGRIESGPYVGREVPLSVLVLAALAPTPTYGEGKSLA